MKKYFYLIKRFFKHPGIYIIFGLVFASLFCLKNFSSDYGQIATIGVVLENDYDSTSKDFYDHLLEQKNNFSFAHLFD